MVAAAGIVWGGRGCIAGRRAARRAGVGQGKKKKCVCGGACSTVEGRRGCPASRQVKHKTKRAKTTGEEEIFQSCRDGARLTFLLELLDGSLIDAFWRLAEVRAVDHGQGKGDIPPHW